MSWNSVPCWVFAFQNINDYLCYEWVEGEILCFSEILIIGNLLYVISVYMGQIGMLVVLAFSF